MQEVIILVGPPDCGRDEWVAANYPDVPCITVDKYWQNPGTYFALQDLKAAYALCVDEFHAALAKAHPRIIVNNTNMRLSHRQKYILLAHNFGYQVFVIVFPFDKATAHAAVLTENPRLSEEAAERTITCDLSPGIYSILPRKS